MAKPLLIKQEGFCAEKGMKRKFKFLAVFAALTLIITSLPLLAQASDNAIESGKLNIVIDGGTERKEAKAGDETEIQIKLVNNTAISSLKAKVFWPAELELISAQYDIKKPGDTSVMVNEPIPDGSEEPDWSTVKDHYVFNWVYMTKEVKGDTTFVTLKFKVKEDAKAGEFLAVTAEIDPENVFDKNLDNVDFKLINGGVYVLAADKQTDNGTTDAATDAATVEPKQNEQPAGKNNSVIWITVAAAVAVICAAVAAVLIIKRRKSAK